MREAEIDDYCFGVSGFQKIRKTKIESIDDSYQGRKNQNRKRPGLPEPPLSEKPNFSSLDSLAERVTGDASRILARFIFGKGPEFVFQQTTSRHSLEQIKSEAERRHYDGKNPDPLRTAIGFTFERLVGAWIDEERIDARADNLYLNSKYSHRLLRYLRNHSILNYTPDGADFRTDTSSVTLESIHECKVNPLHNRLNEQVAEICKFFEKHSGKEIELPELYEADLVKHIRTNRILVAWVPEIKVIIPPHHDLKPFHPWMKVIHTPFSVNFTADVARRSLMDMLRI